MKIAGKVALVTGGASGIGKAVSLKLLENGAKLVAILDLDAEVGRRAVSEFSDKFGADRVKYINCDVTQENQLKMTVLSRKLLQAVTAGENLKLLPKGGQTSTILNGFRAVEVGPGDKIFLNSFQEVYDVYGALDIVANNAGIASRDNRKTIEVNLMAVINGTFIAEKLMTGEKRSERGIIINTASMAGLRASPIVNASYTASKHGVVGFTKSLVNSTDAFSKDLRVVAICPAAVETELWTKCDFRTKDRLIQQMEIRKTKKLVISLDMVVDAFIMAIEDDNLHGAIIKVTNITGIAVVNS